MKNLTKIYNPEIYIEKIIYLIIILLPVLVLFWLTPFKSDTTIGNDYGIFPITHQMEMAYSQKHGSFALFSPGFAMGRSQAALTMAQTFHPLFYLASNTPGYWDGDALTLNTLYRIISLALVHLILFIFLRRLKTGIAPAFIISFLTVYNMRMLDLFRYGASLENYTGYLLLCASIGFYFIKRSKFTGPLAIIISSYLLICGGHPQMMYLGLLGAGIATLFIPFILPAINQELKKSFKIKELIKFYLLTAGWLFAGILLSMPYIASFYLEFVSENALRVGQDYKWSLAYGDTFGGALNSFFSPMEADVHGAFGGSQIIIAAVLAPLAILSGKRIQASIVALSLTVILIFLSVTGEATPVHHLFWEYVPLAKTFRTPGRMSMMLPFLLLLLLAWLFSDSSQSRPLFGKKIPLSKMALPALAGLVLLYVYHNYIQQLMPLPSRYTPHTIVAEKMRDMDLLKLYDQMLPISYQLGLASLALAFLYSVQLKKFSLTWKAVTGTLLAITVIAQVTGTLRFGTWQTKVRPYPTLLQMDEQKKHDLVFRGSPGFGMEAPSVTEQMKNSAIDPYLAKFYRQSIGVKDHDTAVKILKIKANSMTAVIEDSNKNLKQNSKSLTKSPARLPDDTVELEYSSFNRINFKVNAQSDGYLTMNQPCDGRWQASVDGHTAKVHRANGLENAVFVKKGTHTVEFTYKSSATFMGVLIALTTVMLLILWFTFTLLKGKKRFIGITLAVVPILPFAIWNHSLYNGDNLETTYRWSSADFSSPDNIAYGKSTSMSSIRSSQMPYYYYSGFAVDGQKNGRSFVTSPRQYHPWWQVDLGRSYNIGTIRIFDRGQGRRVLPLKILISNDGRHFSLTRNIISRGSSPVWTISLNSPSARFVRLQSGGRGVMNFAEVEIYKAIKPATPAYTDQTDPTGNLRHPVTIK